MTKICWPLFLALVLGVACDDGDSMFPSVENPDALNQIVCIGDSRVEGFRPDYESYRFPLWKILVENDVSFDLIGTRADQQDYPDFMGKAFDRDHLAEGGATTATIDAFLAQAGSLNPDIALLGIGGNDLLDNADEPDIVEQTLENVAANIDDIRALNQDVVILIEQIAPGRSDIMDEATQNLFSTYNEGIIQLANDRNTTDAPVISIDMASGWNDSFMADEVHYNEAGAERVALRYYDALQPYLQQ